MIVCVAIYQSYCLGIEAVQESVGARVDAQELPAVQKQREQSMAWVVGFLTIVNKVFQFLFLLN